MARTTSKGGTAGKDMAADATRRRPNEWIAERLRALGRNQKDLAVHMGVEPPRISDILNGQRRVQLDELEDLSRFLQMTPAEVAANLAAARAGGARLAPTAAPGDGGSGGVSSTGAYARNSTLESAIGFPTLRTRDRDLPIYGAAEGGNGVMILDSDPIEYGERPANLLGVVGAYGVYVVNDSMAPAYEPGDKLHIHPGRPLKPGRDAIFVSETDDGTRHATVKRLVKITDKAWKVEQFNPPRIFDLPRKTWQRAFRIVGSERAD